MAVRLFLGISLVIWTGYGFYCFFVPASLETGAGILAMTPAGTAELRAMYGGLQIAIGLLAGAGLVYASLRRTALVALTFLTGGLAIARLIGAGLDGGFGDYTNAALVFEFVSTAISLGLWMRSESSGAPV